ncbi:MAG: hypothetical protein GX422_03330 [Deltaproteobacteria bacterium]|nr:hypothetical protein [Deltaproteobacteria bacterium]
MRWDQQPAKPAALNPCSLANQPTVKRALLGVKRRIGIHRGQYYDSETGLHYNWHRYYEPKTGRYLTPESIGLAR